MFDNSPDQTSVKRRVATVIALFIATFAIERWFGSDPDEQNTDYLKAVGLTTASVAVTGVVAVVASATLALAGVATAVGLLTAATVVAAKVNDYRDTAQSESEFDFDSAESEPVPVDD